MFLSYSETLVKHFPKCPSWQGRILFRITIYLISLMWLVMFKQNDPGWNTEIYFNLIFVFTLCTCLTPNFHSSCSFLCTYFFCPVFVDVKTTKEVFCSLCWVATLFIFCSVFFVFINEKKITTNNSHALRQENPKTKHFHHWCIKMRKEASLYLRICCCFLRKENKVLKVKGVRIQVAISACSQASG